jgi:hypothetical protein
MHTRISGAAASARPLARTAATAGVGARPLEVAALGLLLGAKALAGWGVQWDIRWHLLIGRDSFWIAPHLMTYAGVTVVALVSFAVLAAGTGRRRHGVVPAGSVTVLGLTGSPGWHLAWWGIALTILAAPVDDFWHRLFGLDVTLWSPPHLLGLLGAQVNTLGTLRITLELWGPDTGARRAVGLLAGILLFGGFAIAIDEGVQTAFRHGGLLFFTWPLLGGLVLSFVLVLAARGTGLRWAPLLVAAGGLLLHLAGLAVGDAGFAWVQPVPAVEEAIAAQPDSPVAIAHEMARRNGTPVGRSLLLRWLPIAPALLLALADARRRPALGGLAFALGLLALGGTLLARLPALAHARPSPADTALAVALAAAAGLAAGRLAARLADRLAPAPTRI